MSATLTQELLEQPNALAEYLSSFAIGAKANGDPVQISQIRHRLAIISSWFGDLPTAAAYFKDKTGVEIGCGQGDMTIAIASLLSEHSHKLYAVDPAPPEYGSPFTLGQAQSHLSSTSLGTRIEWVRAEPLLIPLESDWVRNANFFVLAHCLFYLESEKYLSELLRKLSSSSQISMQNNDGYEPKLLVAEWGMRCSVDEAKPHLCAVRAQSFQPRPEGNVRTIILPEKIKVLAEGAGWIVEHEHWIESPEVDDGKWEVAAARSVRKSEQLPPEVTELLEDMERSITMQASTIRCMDVWTCVFRPKANSMQ